MTNDAKPSEQSPRLLLVEDEEPILEGLSELFTKQGFIADRAADGTTALELLARSEYDLVVLDLMIPNVPGLDVLRTARERGDATPVLILTARGAEEDIVAGLESGADDYVTKPFGIKELVARVRGLLRRRGRPMSDGAGAAPAAPRHIVVGETTIDLDRLRVTWRDGDLALTSREGYLIEHLFSRRERAVSREELLVDVWGYRDGTVRTRTVDVHVQQLRSKLRVAPGGDRLIVTVRGRGYRFGAEVE